MVKKRKRQKRDPDYYTFFIMGLILFIVGLAVNNLGLFIIGLIFFIIGLANKNKWKKKR